MSQETQHLTGDKLRDPNYKGELSDKTLLEGTNKNRGCTDILCCLIFVAFWVGLVVIGSIAFSQGDPNRLAQGYDGDGNACGQGNATDYPYIYFPWLNISNFTTDGNPLKRSVCVKECPGDNATSVECFLTKTYQSCQESAANKFAVYPTNMMLGKICYPKNNTLSAAIGERVHIDEYQSYFKDIQNAKTIIYACAGIALAIGFIYLFVVRFCAGPMVWASIIALIGSLIFFGVFYYQAYQQKTTDASALTSGTAQDQLKSEARNSLYFSIGCFALGAIALILTICFCSKIRLAIAVLKAAGRFVQETISVVILPPVMFVLFILTFTYFVIAALYLYSSGTPYYDPNNYTPFPSFQFNQTLKNMIYYHLFGGLWSLAFNIALTEFILASTCCMWFFKEDSFNKIITSAWRAIRYHLGTLAFGSFLLAVVWTIRIIFEYAAKKAKETGAEQQAGIGFLIKCMRCCLDCFERFIRFINRNAYIQCALTGKNFCSSAQDAFFLILRNAGRFALVEGLGELFIYIGQAFITGITAFLGYLIITKTQKYSSVISSPLAPTLCFVIVSYFVAANFMSVYGVSTEAILQCFLTEEELNAPQKKCPPELKEFLDNEKK